MNSLSAIAGHEGDEEDWENEMRGLQNEEEVSHCTYYTHLQPEVVKITLSLYCFPTSTFVSPFFLIARYVQS